MVSDFNTPLENSTDANLTSRRKKLFTGILVFIVLGIVISDVLLVMRVTSTTEEYSERPPLGEIHLGRFDVHPFLSLVLRPTVDDPYMNVNRFGFRGDDIQVSKPENTFRIFALGGSTVLSYRLPYEDTYPAVLQIMLEKTYPDMKFEVQNAGSDWYTTTHSLINYEIRIRRFQPDLIIIYHGINDLVHGFSPPWWSVGEYKEDYSHHLGPLIRAGKTYSDNLTPFQDEEHLLSMDPQEVWEKLETPDEPMEYLAVLKDIFPQVEVDTFRSIDSFSRNLDLLIDIVRMDNHSIIVCSQPFLYHVPLSPEEEEKIYFPFFHAAENMTYPNTESMIRGMELFNSEAYRVAQENGVPFVDLESRVPKNLTYFIDDVHMTAKGTKIVAELLHEYIIRNSVVK